MQDEKEEAIRLAQAEARRVAQLSPLISPGSDGSSPNARVDESGHLAIKVPARCDGIRS